MTDSFGRRDQAAAACRTGTVSERRADQLLGLCQGLLADGDLTRRKAEFLFSWLRSRGREAGALWPGDVLLERLWAGQKNGSFTGDTLADLTVFLFEIIEEDQTLERREDPAAADEDGGGEDAAPVFWDSPAEDDTPLPLDFPVPEVAFLDRSFCFAGVLKYSSLLEAEDLVRLRGGEVHRSPVQNLDYLVVGLASPPNWKQTSWGRKIKKALDFRTDGSRLCIIAEDTFRQAGFLEGQPPLEKAAGPC
ncbi:MAG: hypothetical protein LBK52_05205 [Deltaproteobacteria bacterium]|nr:hypothetical protein [Deltaproteobacteria bacterium]